MSATATRTAAITCADCGQIRPHEAKGMCSPCYYRDYRIRRKNTVPRRYGSRLSIDDFAHEYRHFSNFGYDLAAIAARLGMTRDAAYQQLARARRAGLILDDRQESAS